MSRISFVKASRMAAVPRAGGAPGALTTASSAYIATRPSTSPDWCALNQAGLIARPACSSAAASGAGAVATVLVSDAGGALSVQLDTATTPSIAIDALKTRSMAPTSLKDCGSTDECRLAGRRTAGIRSPNMPGIGAERGPRAATSQKTASGLIADPVAD